jgi:hypothetical protein
MGLALVTILLACSRPAPVTTTNATLERGLSVEKADGVEPERVQRMVAPAVDPLKHCMPGSSGKINIDVRRIEGKLELDVEPSPSLDPTARACALAALSKVQLEETGSNAGGVSVPPTNFTSILRLTW